MKQLKKPKMMKKPIEVTTTTQVTCQFKVSVETFRQWLGIQEHFEIVDVKIDDDGSKYNYLFVETRKMSAKELADRQYQQREEAGEIEMEDDTQPERQPKRTL